jgi:1,4-alpha-glucan branching enzyme
MAKELAALKEQSFRFSAPDAENVALVGDFTDWQLHPVPMTKGSGGVWTANVKLTPGRHTYLFIVDGEWCEDPECAMRVPNPFGSFNMVRQVA